MPTHCPHCAAPGPCAAHSHPTPLIRACVCLAGPLAPHGLALHYFFEHGLQSGVLCSELNQLYFMCGAGLVRNVLWAARVSVVRAFSALFARLLSVCVFWCAWGMQDPGAVFLSNFDIIYCYVYHNHHFEPCGLSRDRCLRVLDPNPLLIRSSAQH